MSAQPAAGALIERDHPVTPPAAAPLSGDEQRVWELLPHGRANAITQARLAAAAGVSTRQLQDILKSLTEDHGLPVCAACSEPMGSFVPATPAEAEPYIRQLRSRALSCFARIKALNGAVAHELAAEIQELLPLSGTPHVQGQRVNADLTCTAKPRPGKRPTDGVPNGDFCWCGKPLTGRQVVACSDPHRDVVNGRRKLERVRP